MKQKALVHRLLVLALVGLFVGPTAMAQPFSSGSDGSFGPIELTQNRTIDLPPDGIIHATTITLNNRTLNFRRNARNTPVYLLATGDVVLNGTISVDGGKGSETNGGPGGPGGFFGGAPGSLDTPPGAGHGPGGGGPGTAASETPESVGPGSYATRANIPSEQVGQTYGSPLLIPIVGGSGGGGTIGTPGSGGSGGGGAILIASNTSIDLPGQITARGGDAAVFRVRSGGSGGAVRLVAPKVSGRGSIQATGRAQGGAGRIRVDTLDRTDLDINFTPSSTTAIGSLMLVFPDPLPRLDIVKVGDRDIAVGAEPTVVLFPFGSSPNRTVTIQASDFNEVIPIEVVLTPDNGDPIRIEAEIDNQSSNPATTEVSVSIPLNVQTAINVWTRSN